MLNRFLAAYRLELRLIVLHWSYWLLMALWSLWIVSSYNSWPAQTAASLLWVAFPASAIALGSLAFLFMAGISASRAQRSRIDRLEMTFPAGTEVTLARWSATLSAFAGFLIVPLVLGLIAGPFTDFVAIAPIFIGRTLLIFALTTAIVWVIEITIGIRRWVYPLLALLWLGAGFSSSMNTHQFPWALLLGFSTYAWSGLSYSTLWGVLMEGNLPFMVTVTYAGVLLFLMSVVVWRTVRQRFYRPAWGVFLGGAAGLVITLAGGIGYSSTVMAASSQRSEREQIMNQTNTFTLPQGLSYAPTSYDLTLDMSDANTPTFSARILVTNLGDQPLDQLAFSLNQQLEVTQVNLPYTRQGDDLDLTPPQPLPPKGTLTLDITYRGAIWWYDSYEELSRPPTAEAFVKPDGVNLPCSIAWYPIPGTIPVGVSATFAGSYSPNGRPTSNDSDASSAPGDSLPNCLLSQPADFTLHIENASGLHFASNLPSTDADTFASPSASWLHLLAAPALVTENADPITVISAQSQLDLAKSAAQTYYIPALHDLQQDFPDIQHLNLFALDAGFGGFFSLPTPLSGGTLTVVADPANLLVFPRNPYEEFLDVDQAMIASLFGNSRTSLSENVAYFLRAYRQAQGDEAQIQTLLSAGISQGNSGSYYYTSQTIEQQYAIAFALNDIYVKQGDAALKTLLGQIRANAGTLNTQPDDAIVAWIKETADAH